MLDLNRAKICIEMELDPRELFHAPTRLTYKTLIELFEEGQQEYDVITFVERLKAANRYEKIGGGAELSAMLDNGVPRFSEGVFRRHIEIVQECARRRRLMRMLNDSLTSLSQPDISTGQAIEEVRRKLDAITPKQVARAQDIRALVESAEVRATERANGTRRIVKTGFRDLDVMMGGCQPGDLCVIAARPGVGKTTFGVQWVLRGVIPEKKSCLVVSYEVPDWKFVDRMIQIEGKIPGEIFQPAKFTKKEWEKFAEASECIERARVCVLDTSHVRNTLQAVAYETRRMHEVSPLDVLLIDYVQLMQGREQHRHEAIAAITRGLKLLAMELGIVVVGLCQLNRAVEDRKNETPRLSDLRESGSIEQDADQVLFVDREKNGGPSIVPASAILEKNRNGRTGRCKLEYDNDIGCFIDRD